MNRLGGVIQYQNQGSAAGNTTAAVSAGREAGQVSGSLRDQLPPGKVFEGTITDMKDGVVTIGLDNGKSISARMEAGVTLRPGEPMLFEVRSNNGTQIAIRPVALESAGNPTLLNALTAAGLPANAKNLSLVNMMMKQQLPVDKNSLMQMTRTMSTFKNADVETLLQMKKLGFPITKDNIVQFENYRNNQHSLMQQLDGLMDSLVQPSGKEAVSPKQLLAFQQQLLAIFDPGGQTEAPAGAGFMKTPGQEGIISENKTTAAGIIENAPLASERLDGLGGAPGGIVAGSKAVEGNQPVLQNNTLDQTMAAPTAETVPQSARAMEGALTPQQQQTLEQQLRGMAGMEDNPVIFKDGRLNTETSPQELLRALQDTLAKGLADQQLTGTDLSDFFSGAEYKSLLKQVMEQQWTLKPEEVAAKENLEKLYERVKSQMDSLETLIQNSGNEGAVTKNVSNVKSNLDFMNQVNQLYTYIQIPLKLMNQQAHSDLYVYTNKKNLRDREGELSALLHLDLENLGSSDIHIKMLKNAVTVNFYLADESAINLLKNNMDSLTTRLEEKGYSCQVGLEKRQEKVDFVEDFLEQEKPAGTLHRYSFDVKA